MCDLLAATTMCVRTIMHFVQVQLCKHAGGGDTCLTVRWVDFINRNENWFSVLRPTLETN